MIPELLMLPVFFCILRRAIHCRLAACLFTPVWSHIPKMEETCPALLYGQLTPCKSCRTYIIIHAKQLCILDMLSEPVHVRFCRAPGFLKRQTST